MNKKSEIELRTILLLVLCAVFLLWFSLWLYQQQDSQESFKENVECKLSVKASAQTNDPNLIDCPREYIKISNNNEKEIENAKHKIAQSLAICKNQYSEGTDELFAHIDGNFCGICDIYEFEDDKYISNFDDYLMTHNVSLPGVKKMFYAEYLSGVKMDLGIIKSFKSNPLKEVNLDPHKKYVSVFIYSKDSFFFAKHNLQRIANEFPQPIKIVIEINSLFFGYSPGADWIAGTMLIPFDEEELKKKCEYLVG